MYFYKLIDDGYEIYYSSREDIAELKIEDDVLDDFELRFTQVGKYSTGYADSIEASAIIHCAKLNERERKIKINPVKTLPDIWKETANNTVKYLMDLAKEEKTISMEDLPEYVQKLIAPRVKSGLGVD